MSIAKYILNFSTKSIYPRQFLFPYNNELYDPTVDIILVWSLGVHAPIHLSCIDYTYIKSYFYRHLIPIEMIRRNVENIISNFFSYHTVIGIHIRIQNNKDDWNVVPPTNPFGTSSISFEDASPIEYFIHIIENIIFKNPTFKFFIASNNVFVKNHLLDRFSVQNIITLQNEISATRSSSDAIQFALIEFLLLSETALIIHSRGSSFAREASFFHSRPVIDVRTQ